MNKEEMIRLRWRAITGNLTVKGKILSSNGEVLAGKVLYNNDSGTTGTVTLTESAANFSCIEICYKSRYSERNSIKIHEPEGKPVNLAMFRVFPKSGTNVAISRFVRISGTSIFTVENTTPNDYYGEWWSYNNSINNDNNMYIYKVIGYR